MWSLLGVIAVLNGGIRNGLVTSRVGEQAGHITSTITGCAAFLLVIWLMLPWIRPATRRYLPTVGLFWLGLTVAFEFLAGHYVFGNSWGTLFSDYNVLRGRLWIAVLVVTLFGPTCMGRLRGRDR